MAKQEIPLLDRMKRNYILGQLPIPWLKDYAFYAAYPPMLLSVCFAIASNQPRSARNLTEFINHKSPQAKEKTGCAEAGGLLKELIYLPKTGAPLNHLRIVYT